MNSHQPEQEGTPQTLVRISFENIFRGSELVYANLDDLTIDRVKSALATPVLAAHSDHV